ncbi:MAG: DNA mismatch endonuclease Vsr [Rhodobacteraceae bacterium]|nr:DNA mismatch endonuclease Vsr [Paracoccaceae bacterium]
MVDIVTPEKRSEMMAGISGKNTKPEIFVRQTLHRMGYRFRLHRKDLPGKPDIFLPRYRVAIFVQGCFWHGHGDCHLFRLPKTRVKFWEIKIFDNKERDARMRSELIQAGYRVLDIWECTIKGKTALDTGLLEKELNQFISNSHKNYHEIRGRDN